MAPNTPAPATDCHVGLIKFQVFFRTFHLASSKSAFQSHCLVSSFITRLSHDLESNSV